MVKNNGILLISRKCSVCSQATLELILFHDFVIYYEALFATVESELQQQTPPVVTDMSKGAFHNRGKSESLRVAFLDKNKTPNFKQQIRLVFTMEISKTGQNCSVLALYVLSNYLAHTDCMFSSSCTSSCVFNSTRWTTLYVTYKNRHFKRMYAIHNV